MVSVNNDDLRNVYHYLSTLDFVLTKEIRKAQQEKGYVDKMVPDGLQALYSTKKATTSDFTDNLTRTQYESAVLALVATFERVAFQKYQTTYGELKKVVKSHTDPSLPYFDAREQLINDKIEFLSGIFDLLNGKIEQGLYSKLKALKTHRNYIVHGKRLSAVPAIEYSIDEMVQILDQVIEKIG